MLGRLIPDYFPKIFGKTEKEPLDVNASRVLFEELAKEINASHSGEFSLDDVVYGYSFFFCLSLSSIFDSVMIFVM
jgi:5-oxoprolinase (ATP-hydrolysing)